MVKKVFYSAHLETAPMRVFEGPGGNWIPWAIAGFQAYADTIGATFRLIDNTDPTFLASQKALRTVQSNCDFHLQQILAYHSTFYALQSFLESDADQFYWLDLDIGFVHFDIDIFSIWRPGFWIPLDLNQPYGTLVEDTHGYKKFVGHSRCGVRLGFPVSPDPSYCSAHILTADRSSAEKLVAFFSSLQPNTPEFWHFAADTFNRGGRVCDETLLEIAMNYVATDLDFHKLKTQREPLSMYEARHFCTREKNSVLANYEWFASTDCFMVHFRGQHKQVFEEFYRKVSRTGIQIK